MQITPFTTHRIVLSADQNHHGTLFAGRASEWFIGNGLMCVSQLLPPDNIVCVKLHGMDFKRPVQLGEIVDLTSKAVLAGRSSIVVHTEMTVEGEHVSGGFVTYVNTGADGRAIPHGVTLEPACEEDETLIAQALELKKK